MTETMTVDGREIAVREMTVSDQREWLKHRTQAGKEAAKAGDNFDVMSWSLFEDVNLFDLPFMTDLPVKALEDMKPTDIQRVVDMCKKVNPHFFAMRERAGL